MSNPQNSRLSKKVDMLSPINFLGEIVIEPTLTSLPNPNNSKLGQLRLYKKILYVCTLLDDKPTWYPISFKKVYEFFEFNTNSTKWIIQHSLSTKNVLVKIYDKDGNQMTADNIQLIDKDTINIIFNIPKTGDVYIFSNIIESDIVNTEPPNLVLPFNGTADLNIFKNNFDLELNTFSMVTKSNSPDIHELTVWQIATDEEFNNVILDLETSEYLLKLPISLIRNLFSAGTTYYWRAKFKGTTLGYTEFSDPYNFKVTEISLDNWSLLNLGGTSRSLSLTANGFFNNNIYNITGNIGGTNLTRDVFKIDLGTNRWESQGTGNNGSRPNAMQASAFCQDFSSNIVYIIGGLNSSQYLTDVRSFNLTNNNWGSLSSGGIYSPRAYNNAHLYNNEIYVYGGFDDGYRNDFFKFNILTNTWSSINFSGVRPSLAVYASCIINDKIYIHGGLNWNGVKSELYVYDITANTMTLLDNGNVPITLYFHQMINYKGYLMIHGGQFSTTEFNNKTHVYNLSTNTWRELEMTGNLPIPSSRGSLIRVVDDVYYVGGFIGNNSNTSNVYKLT